MPDNDEPYMGETPPTNVNELLKELGTIAGFKNPDKQDALNKRICVKCAHPAAQRCYTDAGRKEWAISGLCELCFDAIFADDDPEHPHP